MKHPAWPNNNIITSKQRPGRNNDDIITMCVR